MLPNCSPGTFAEEVLEVIFHYSLLDGYLRVIQQDRDGVMPAIATAYLERKILHAPKDGNCILLRIRSVAERLSQEDGGVRDADDYIKQLVPMILETRFSFAHGIWDTEGAIMTSSDFESDLYVAAIYTQTTPVVERWLARGKDTRVISYIFGLAWRHAAIYGSEELLATMLGHDSIRVRQDLRSSMLTHVAEAGRLQATRFIFNYDTDQYPWEFASQRMPHAWKYTNGYRLSTLRTPSREVFDYVMEKRTTHIPDKEFDPERLSGFLCQCAQDGWTDMAAYYLELGAGADGMESGAASPESRPLSCACKAGHKDIVQLLLDHGADTSSPALEYAIRRGHLDITQMLLKHGAELGNALYAAAVRGNLPLLKELLSYAADTHHDLQPLLAQAVWHEHEAMFSFLLERGVDAKDPNTSADCVEMARTWRLESMLNLLAEAGVQVDENI